MSGLVNSLLDAHRKGTHVDSIKHTPKQKLAVADIKPNQVYNLATIPDEYFKKPTEEPCDLCYKPPSAQSRCKHWNYIEGKDEWENTATGEVIE